MKVKNKKRLIIFSTLYIVGYLYFCIFGGINYGMKISDNPALDIMIRSSGFPVGVRNLSLVIFIWIILSFFMVLSILWQTDLAGQKLNRTALICLGINLLFTCLSRGIVESIVSGVAGTFYNADNCCCSLCYRWCRYRNHLFRTKKERSIEFI